MLTQHRENDQHKKTISKKIKEKWKDPDHIYNDETHKKNRNKIISNSHSTIESRTLKRQLTLKQWRQPNPLISSNAVRTKKSYSMKNWWANLSDDDKKQLYQKQKDAINNPLVKYKMSMRAKKLWETQSFILKMKKARKMLPNKKEQQLQSLLNNIIPNTYKFVGDLSLMIGRKNPDFISVQDNKLIEFFGNYWHSKLITGINEQHHETERIDYFKTYGYDTLVIWENELQDLKRLNIRIINFHKRK